MFYVLSKLGFLFLRPSNALILAMLVGAGMRLFGWRRRGAELIGFALVLLVMLVSTMLFAWVSSLISPAWANRYVGVAVGPLVSTTAGVLVAAGSAGFSVGAAVGSSVGAVVGATVGSAVGATVGSSVGVAVGSSVGVAVGSSAAPARLR